MTMPDITAPTIEVHLDADWIARALVDDVKVGLGARPFRIPPRWLYDDRGSDLFDQITRLPSYYPTELERATLRRSAGTIAELSGADTIIELGSGTSDKTHTLIEAFRKTGQLKRFVALEVSEQTLRDAADDLAETYPGLQVQGVVGDFTLHLSKLPTDGVPIVAFLGSTIGNFYVEERRAFLFMLGEHLAPGGWLLLGLDLVKPVDRLIAAYNDPQGVTEQFSKNVLTVLNRELGANFEVDAFEHIAFWDPILERMDLRLRVDGDHQISIPGAELDIDLRSGEEIQVEVSTKFRLPAITEDLENAGFEVRRHWTDAARDTALILSRAN
jgi:L-histidine N-alpha-methyltransferase